VKNIPITRMRIVRATLHDLPSISDLAGVIWRACYAEILSTAQIDYMLAKMYSLETLQSDLRQGIRYERLLAGEQFVGFAALGPTQDTRAFKLHKLYLHPDWHGRGFGSLLLQHCQTEALTLGARRLILTVNKRNQKAIATYERNGFAIVESIVTDIGGGFVMDDYVMAKDLQEIS
jgi:ribosomal protein S18 acetylase RimI-like enzyme